MNKEPHTKIEELIKLRSFLRVTWQSHATAIITLYSYMDNKINFNESNNLFLSKESIVFNLLTSARAFIRIAERISKTINIDYLQKSNKNLKEEFPDHKNARDILEHFDEYTKGKGNLRKQGIELSGELFNIYFKENIVMMQIYNLEPINISNLAYWIDWHMSQLEEALYKIISPHEDWKGFYPQTWN